MTDTLHEHLAKIAPKGGAARTERKAEAVRENLRKARERKALYRQFPGMRPASTNGKESS